MSAGNLIHCAKSTQCRFESLIKINVPHIYNGYYPNRSLKNNFNYLLMLKEFHMKIIHLAAMVSVLVLVGCKPSAPETPDPSKYGQTIQPFHQIPAEAQEGQGKARSTEEKSQY
ncbi:hypothetical protein SAMN05421754_10127 [Nitrosomonas sp. Nm58]|jgi:hypothetical protein|nr:hypothetical protein SAMN05421754_10127 [Nitrosomonas sp. Nm58]